MLEDDEVRAIWAARGGSGCLQLLPHIDYARVRRHPKIVIGFSDLTALHLALHHKAGLVTFHGPTAGSTFSEFSVASMRAVLMEPKAPEPFALSEEHLRKAAEQPQFRPRTLVPGRAEGLLFGGNLSMVCAMMGTPDLPSASGALLFLEEVGEAPYRVDRMLTQLRLSGALAGLRGIIVGHFTDVPDHEDGERRLDEVFAETADALEVPCVAGVPIGHVDQQWTLPLGRTAELVEGAVHVLRES